MKKTLLIALAVLVTVTGMYAVKASKTIKVHQGSCDEATDLHFTTYQKETNISINSYNISVSGFSNVNTTPNDHGVGDDLTHGVDVDCDGGSVPYCSYVTITVEFDLTSWNTVRFEDIDWTTGGDPDDETNPPDTVSSGVPNHGYAVDYIDPFGNSTYWFYNDDTVPVTVRNFKAARNQPSYIYPEDIFGFGGWTDFFPEFTVPPQSFYAIPLTNMIPGMFLYTHYDIYIPGNAFHSEELVFEGVDEHEDQTNEDVEPLGIEEQGLLEAVKFLDVAAYPDYSQIRFQLPKATHANLTVYSLSGEKVVTLVDEVKAAGGHTITWNGTTATGGKAPAGIYVCKLSADGICAAEKMVRIR
jgi:hypothetical protein